MIARILRPISESKDNLSISNIPEYGGDIAERHLSSRRGLDSCNTFAADNRAGNLELELAS